MGAANRKQSTTRSFCIGVRSLSRKWCGVPARSLRSELLAHGSAKPCLCALVPIRAVQLKKDRSIRNRQPGLDDQHFEPRCGMIEPLDDLLVRSGPNIGPPQ